MHRTIPISAGDLKPGMKISDCGTVRTVVAVRPSLGNGWHVTCEDGVFISGAISVGAVVQERSA